MPEYIYLLQEREFIKTEESIYKIGKSKQENLKRITNYPNGTMLIFQILCNDCDSLEKKLLAIFRQKYEPMKEIGSEYFRGDYNLMIKDIYDITFNKKTDVVYITTLDEYLKYSSINDIILTNIDTCTGYFRLKNEIWRNFSDNLISILKCYCTIDSENESKIDYEKILNDIYSKCYISKIDTYLLKYHEFICKVENNIVILNTSLQNILDYDTKSGIIENSMLSNRNITLKKDVLFTANTQIIYEILNFLVSSENIQLYKKFCRNILVQQKDPIIFSDYTENNLLTKWIKDMVYTICSSNDIYGYFLEFNNFKRETYKKNGIKARLIIISQIYTISLDNYGIYTESEIQEQISFIQKELKVTSNICVKYKKDIFQHSEYNNFVSFLIQKFGNRQIYSKLDVYNIFYSQDLLFNNFLKWIIES